MSRQEAKAIAQDVIDHINGIGQLKKLTYFEGVVGKIDLSAEPQTVIDEIAANCKVCALGALLLSSIRKYDRVLMKEITFDHPINGKVFHMFSNDIKTVLSRFFSFPQVRMIEAAFEVWGDYVSPNASAFGRQYANLAPRLIAIMQNIVDNDGEFKP